MKAPSTGGIGLGDGHEGELMPKKKVAKKRGASKAKADPKGPVRAGDILKSCTLLKRAQELVATQEQRVGVPRRCGGTNALVDLTLYCQRYPDALVHNFAAWVRTTARNAAVRAVKKAQQASGEGATKSPGAVTGQGAPKKRPRAPGAFTFGHYPNEPSDRDHLCIDIEYLSAKARGKEPDPRVIPRAITDDELRALRAMRSWLNQAQRRATDEWPHIMGQTGDQLRDACIAIYGVAPEHLPLRRFAVELMGQVAVSVWANATGEHYLSGDGILQKLAREEPPIEIPQWATPEKVQDLIEQGTLTPGGGRSGRRYFAHVVQDWVEKESGVTLPELMLTSVS